MTEIILLKTIKVDPRNGLYRNTIWVTCEPDRPSAHVKWWVVGEMGRKVGILEHEAKEV